MNEVDRKILKNADIIVLLNKEDRPFYHINGLRKMLGLLRSCLGHDFRYSYAPTECNLLNVNMTIHEYFDNAQNMKGKKDSRDPLIFPVKLKELVNALGDLEVKLMETSAEIRQLMAIVESLMTEVDYLLIECPARNLHKNQIDSLKEYLTKNKSEYQSVIILSNHAEYWHTVADYYVDFDKNEGVYSIFDNNLKKKQTPNNVHQLSQPSRDKKAA